MNNMKSLFLYGTAMTGSLLWMTTIVSKEMSLYERTIFCCIIGFISGCLAESRKRKKLKTVLNIGATISIISICVSIGAEAVPSLRESQNIGYGIVAFCGFIGLPGAKTIELASTAFKKFLPGFLVDLLQDEETNNE